MLGLVTTPGQAHSTAVVELPPPRPAEGELLLRTLEVGVCGTDREISEGAFGVAPEQRERLLLGHELLAVVEREGHGFARGELVTATVRRSCGRCEACSQGAPDACHTGDYAERGITRLDGFASELTTERAEHLVRVPAALGRLGVLAEPASVCARAIRHARAVAERQPWRSERALVIGPGAIGMLSTYFLRVDGFEVWVAGRSPGATAKAELAEACGARYVCSTETPLPELAADVGGFDLVVEAAGDAQVMLDTLGLLRQGGVACLLGVDGRSRRLSLEGRVLGVDTILQNRALLGSVNAGARDWEAAVERLDRARRRWGEALEQFVGLRVAVDRFEDAFAYTGVKATLRFAPD
ncbi:MAG TPA: alcohol dehydrogenase catalytic domain-containing protein [Thermoleophilaceae bacterium]|nr:alcohol dehydrogenase catalytic domain-containing protein [Thermoleophilaceae bacterium]